MSACPKCGKKLKLYNLGQNCPHCGVNMRFYGYADQFYHDAKKAELSMAKVSVKMKRLKTALIGGKLPIVRLCFMLLPLLSTLLPTATATLKLPFTEKSIAIGVLGIYGAFSDGSLTFIGEMVKSGTDGAAFAAFFNALCAAAAMIVCAVLIFLCTILCFISIKKMSCLLCGISCLGIVSCAVTGVLANSFCKAAETSDGIMLGCKMSFGFILTAVFFAAVFAINFTIAKNGLKIEYAEGDLERVEIAKKVKSGELKLDDLPQPIVETAETRAIDEEIRKQQQQYDDIKAERAVTANEKA